MCDPNAVYKAGFAELTRESGRVPTANECLSLHDAYKASYQEEINARKQEERAKVPVQLLSHGETPGDGGSRTADAQAARAPGVAAGGAEPLTKPGTPDTREQAQSEPEPPEINPRPPERRYTAGRGPGGGVLAMCARCGQEWERPLKAGRPASRCEPCRK